MSETPVQLGSRSWAWLGRIPGWTWDVVPVAIIGVSLALSAIHAHPGWLPAIAVSLVAVVVLLARRRAPLAVLGMAGSATFVVMVTQTLVSAAPVLSAIVALYTVDTRCSRRWSVAASLVSFAGAVTAGVLMAPSPAPRVLETSIAPAAVIIALWVFGDNLRVRRAYVAGLEERAVWVDAQRAADARAAADDERARIARELHDVVAHHVAVMAIQAGAARMLNPTADERTRDLLGSIENTSHQAMSELRRLLGVLRRADSAPRNPAPQPGLDHIDQLIEQVRQAGLPVDLTVRGSTDGLPDWVDLSAYRIVQEALTNVLKHAGPAPTTVVLQRRASDLTVLVTNEAPVSAPATPGGRPGHGLIGMRERVDMARGELRTGPTDSGGFEVFARLPADPRRRAPLRVQLTGNRR